MVKRAIFGVVLGFFFALIICSLLSQSPLNYYCQDHPNDPVCSSFNKQKSKKPDSSVCDDADIQAILLEGKKPELPAGGSCSNVVSRLKDILDLYEKAEGCASVLEQNLSDELKKLNDEIEALKKSPEIKNILQLSTQLQACETNLADICCGGSGTSSTTSTTSIIVFDDRDVVDRDLTSSDTKGTQRTGQLSGPLDPLAGYCKPETGQEEDCEKAFSKYKLYVGFCKKGNQQACSMATQKCREIKQMKCDEKKYACAYIFYTK